MFVYFSVVLLLLLLLLLLSLSLSFWMVDDNHGYVLSMLLGVDRRQHTMVLQCFNLFKEKLNRNEVSSEVLAKTQQLVMELQARNFFNANAIQTVRSIYFLSFFGLAVVLNVIMMVCLYLFMS